MKKLILLLISTLIVARAQHTITIIPDATTTGQLVFRELNSNGLNYVSIQAKPALSGNVALFLPTSVGVAGDCVMNGATPGEWTMSTCGAGGLPVSDTISIVHQAADATALMRFDATLVAPSTVIVLAIPNHNMLLAGVDVDNMFTANQTFHDIFCYTDNGCNIGVTATRFNTLAVHNVDSAPPGDIAAYTIVNHLAVVDHLSGGAGIGTPSAFWDFLVNAGGIGNSGMSVRDNSGATVLDLRRAGGGLVDEARLDMDFVPSQASLSGVQSHWSLGIPLKKWNQLYVSGLNVNTVFTDLLPSGTLNLGNTSNRWNLFAAAINLNGDLTTHNILCYVDNGCNIGTSAVRFNTLAIHNIDSAPAGDFTAYTMVNHLAIVDHLNGGAGIGTPSAFWDFLALANGLSSALTIRDNSGVETLVLNRAAGTSVFNEAQFDLSLVPSQASISGVISSRNVGSPTKLWGNGYFNHLNVNNCTGCGAPPFIDTGALINGSVDATKTMRFEVDGFTTATLRVLTPQNSDYILAGINIAQTFTASQTFHDVLCFVDNGCNIGVTATRFNTLAIHNIDSAPPGDSAAYTMVNHLAIVDHVNGGAGIGTPSAFWDVIVNATGSASSGLFVRDNSGLTTFELVRATGSAVINEARFDLNVVPSQASLSGVQSNFSLGIPTKKWNQLYISGLNVNTVFTDLIPSGALNIGNTSNRWNGFFGNLNVTSCTGCGSNLATNNVWTGTNTWNNVVAFNGAAGANQQIFFNAPAGGFVSALDFGPAGLWVEQQADAAGNWLLGHFGVAGGVIESIRAGAVTSTLVLQAGNATFGGNVLAFSAGNTQFVKSNKLVFNWANTASNFQWIMSGASTARLLDNSGSPILQFDTSAGANTTLSASLNPGASITYDIGSGTSNRWRKLWVQDIDSSGSLNLHAIVSSSIMNANLISTTQLVSTSTFELAVDSGPAFLFATSYGSFPAFIGRASGGSLASPTPVITDQLLAAFGGRGWAAGAFTAGNSATIAFNAGEGWTSGAQGSYLSLATTPNGSTVRSEKMRINGAIAFNSVQSAGGFYSTLGFTSDQAFYPKVFASATMNAPGAGYSGFAAKGGSQFWYYNTSTLAWGSVDFAASGACGTCLTTAGGQTIGGSDTFNSIVATSFSATSVDAGTVHANSILTGFFVTFLDTSQNIFVHNATASGTLGVTGAATFGVVNVNTSLQTFGSTVFHANVFFNSGVEMFSKNGNQGLNTTTTAGTCVSTYENGLLISKSGGCL